MDSWTSRVSDTYVTDMPLCNFKNKSCCLKIFFKKSIVEILQKWNIPTDGNTVPLYIVSDNARNFRAALEAINCTLRSCYAHTLQLAIGDAKKETGPVHVPESTIYCWILCMQQFCKR
ncbi:hypothetical protein PR048_005680 [Dryococelus australis]|uniref:Uncharacterized protein n=1 Tax=Dryococelus australis TaxID=614101 RepID=A0ABQ9I8U4_9NEOP|nr:hypothetical protein PR048_005680 [Dryococelus australis]